MKKFNAGYVKGYNECLKEVQEILKNIDPGEEYTVEWYNMGIAIDKILEMSEKEDD